MARWIPSLRLVGLVAGVGLVAVLALIGIAYAVTPIPDPDEAAQAQTATVFFDDGESVLGQFAALDRKIVPLEDIAPAVGEAVVASEDASFYENRGIDPRGIARAFWNNLLGRPVQGGSTLTQQYVERYFLGTTKSYWGKFQEAIIAVKIDREQSKEEILEAYLNTIYFGRGAYGVERASEAYFGKSAKDLDVAQAALLAAVIPSPSNWDPRVDATAAQQRWTRAVDRMVSEGYLTQTERDALAFPETIEFTRSDRYAGPNGYLLDMVRAELIDEGFSEAEIDQGGFRIVSTVNPRWQQAAVEAVASLPESRPENLHVALVSVDPASGAIKALYGGPDFVTQARNDVTQARAQGGSTFKPFTLVAALENGKTLEDRYASSTPMDIELKDGSTYTVRNFDTVNRGPIDLVAATANSVNTVYVQLNNDVGPEKAREVAVRAGLPEDTAGLTEFASNVLGTASPHPIDMASVFATYASGGVRYDRFIVQEVTDLNGRSLYTGGGRGTRVFDAQVIADATYAMEAVVRSGTARTAASLGRPVAGKTGSSQDYRSAWFCGFVPQLSTAVAFFQVGEDGTEETLTPFGGVNPISGGSWPTTVWTRYMRVVLEDLEVLDFPERSRPTRSPQVPTLTPTATPTPTEVTPTGEPSETFVPPGQSTDGPPGQATDTPTETPTGGPGNSDNAPGQGGG